MLLIEEEYAPELSDFSSARPPATNFDATRPIDCRLANTDLVFVEGEPYGSGCVARR